MAVRMARDLGNFDRNTLRSVENTMPSLEASVSIRSLGEFLVLREQKPIAVTEWQSKKSRDLLKILLAKRGRPLHREVIIEILWRGESPARACNRFAVALSRIRSALDPNRGFPQDHFIATSDDAVGLNTSHVDADVLRFLACARRGFASHDIGDESALSSMAAAYEMYHGDFLEADAYEEWAMPLREAARATYIGLAQTLGDLAGERGEFESAVGYYSSVLEKDPYAEGAHVGLVRSAVVVGRHGEARRHYATYAARMAELEIDAAPFPSSITLKLN